MCLGIGSSCSVILSCSGSLDNCPSSHFQNWDWQMKNASLNFERSLTEKLGHPQNEELYFHLSDLIPLDINDWFHELSILFSPGLRAL